MEQVGEGILYEPLRSKEVHGARRAPGEHRGQAQSWPAAQRKGTSSGWRDRGQIRQMAKLMLFAGCFLLLLALYSSTGELNKAAEVGDVLAIGVSALVASSGLVYLLLTRGAADGE